MSVFSKVISFFTLVGTHTRPPESEEDWKLCYDTYAKEVEGFESLDLSMEVFKAIDKGLGSKTKITVNRTTPLAVFYNIKRLFVKSVLPHFDGNLNQDAQLNELDGIYTRFTKHEDYKNTKAAEDFEENDCSLLRFYPDGKALGVGLGGADPLKDWVKIKQWFNREQKRPNYPVGNYVIRGGEKLTITLETKDGDIVYKGFVKGDVLRLSMHSHINDIKLVDLEYKKTNIE